MLKNFSGSNIVPAFPWHLVPAKLASSSLGMPVRRPEGSESAKNKNKQVYADCEPSVIPPPPYFFSNHPCVGVQLPEM